MAKAIDSASKTLFTAVVIGAIAKIAQKSVQVLVGDQKVANDIGAVTFAAGMIGVGVVLEEKEPDVSAAALTLGVAGSVGYLAMRDDLALPIVPCQGDRRAISPSTAREMEISGWSSTGQPLYAAR